MKKPNKNREKELLVEGYKLIAGLDEAGRGSWAGPVVAGCLVYNPQVKIISGVNDSKKISPEKRELLYNWLTNNFDFGVGIIDNNKIDEIGILNATKLAMINAIHNLKSKPDYLLIDAVKLKQNIPQENIIKGDEKIWSIAAASIIAKVTRDRLMVKMAGKFPNYGFERHKGYGTAFHLGAMRKLGICEFHRRSYRPVMKIISKS